MTRTLSFVAVIWLAAGAFGIGQGAADRAMLDKIRAEEAAHSQVAPVFEMLTTNIGPRLTASPADQRAIEFVAQTLTSYGLSNVHKEGWKFGRGWELQKLTVEMVEPRYMPLVAYADGWSAATAGDIVASPVFVGGKSAADVQAMGAQLKGAIRAQNTDGHGKIEPRALLFEIGGRQVNSDLRGRDIEAGGLNGSANAIPALAYCGVRQTYGVKAVFRHLDSGKIYFYIYDVRVDSINGRA